MRFRLVFLVLVGLILALPSWAATVIPNAQVPLVVEQAFQQVYGRKPTPAESTYWKTRARSDKRTVDALTGAMAYQKAHAMVQTAATSVCDRTSGYSLPQEVQMGLAAVRNGLLTHTIWRQNLPVNRFQNCLHITFANNASQLATVSGAVAIFSVKDSNANNLRIFINPDFAPAGYVFLGEVLSHEMTHAWQYLREIQREHGNTEFARYVFPDCYTVEAEAFWTEISYVNNLSEGDKNDLRDFLRAGIQDGKSQQAAYQTLNLIDFADANWTALSKNPVPFLRTHYVMQIPYYVNECSVVGVTVK
jgi:hypothetical protein